MPYRHLDDIAIADAAFEVRGPSLEALFRDAVDALLSVMVENPEAVAARESRPVRLEADALDLLLHAFLEEVVYYKDAECILLRSGTCGIIERENRFQLEAIMTGEAIDPERHELNVDVKAVTFHRLGIRREEDGWLATFVVDI